MTQDINIVSLKEKGIYGHSLLVLHLTSERR